MSTAITFIAYIAISLGAYFLLKKKVLAETKQEELKGYVWVVTIMSAVFMPTLIIGILQVILKLLIFLLG